MEPDYGLYAAPAGVQPEQEAADIERRLKATVSNLQKQLRDARSALDADNDLRKAVFNLADQDVTPPKWLFTKPTAHTGPGIPLLFTSDFQWGEVVDKQQMGGVNEFNQAIAARRYQALIERTIDLSFEHMVRPNYPGMVYLRGGDSISGDIHEDLRETNELSAIPAVVDLVKHEVAGLTALADKFKNIWVVSVPGNHGRSTTGKPRSKAWMESNYDTLAAIMLEQWFRDDKRIKFWTPQSGEALFSIWGWNFLLTHGDRIGSRGGQGFVGPAATILRGMKKVIDYYSTLGTSIDWVLTGHFHVPMELEYGFANGSLPGYSEYARDGRFRPQPPAQWLLFVHPEWGVTARWPILLEKHPRLFDRSKNWFEKK